MNRKNDRSVAPPPPLPSRQTERAVAPPPPARKGAGGALGGGKVSPPPISRALEPAEVSDDDEFVASISREAQNRGKSGAAEDSVRHEGLVLARDADGFERLMDARLVSKESIIVRTGTQVKCPGCENWFPEEKATCPTCFRENWQGAAGYRRKVRRALVAVAVSVAVIVTAGLVYFLQASEFQVVLPLELKVFLWVASPFVLAGVMVWLRRQAMS